MATLLECVRGCDLSGSYASTCLDACVKLTSQLNLKNNIGDDSGFDGLPLEWSLAIAIVLVPLSGLFAGLTLGLLSLDLVGLRILESAGEPQEQEYAKAIIPVRKQGNWLLCTLLLGNTVINSAISILLADVSTGPIGLLASTGLILLFGEILPQSIATKHGLKIGAQCIWMVRFFMILLAPITYPLAVLLDWMVGRDIGMVYSVEELKRLIEIHVTDPWAQAESGLTRADQQLLLGALDYKRKRVRDVMTSLEKVFMLEKGTRLNFQTMLGIYKSGFTRIPVYDGVRQNIVGILYAKDLILIDADDEVEVGAVVSFRGRGVARVSENDTLDGVFKRFLTANNHMLIACNPESSEAGSLEGPNCVPTGLITLEDVLEEVLQEEIVDETDIYEDVDRRVLRRGGNRVDIASFLTMFEHKLPHTNALSVSERQAVIAFLSVNVEEFGVLAQFGRPLEGLIDRAEVVERELPHPQRDLSQSVQSPHVGSGASGNGATVSPAGVGEWVLTRMMSRAVSSTAWEDGVAEEVPPLVLYERGEPSDAFTLILQGRVLIRTGQEGFELEVGPWSVLGNRSLTHADYQPDFDAVALPPFRLLRIRRADYKAAVQATTLDPHIGRQQRGRYTSGRPAPGFDAVIASQGTASTGPVPSAAPSPSRLGAVPAIPPATISNERPSAASVFANPANDRQPVVSVFANGPTPLGSPITGLLTSKLAGNGVTAEQAPVGDHGNGPASWRTPRGSLDGPGPHLQGDGGTGTPARDRDPGPGDQVGGAGVLAERDVNAGGCGGVLAPPVGGTSAGMRRYKAPSPIHGVNNAAEAGAVASEASKEDSARAEAALKTPKVAKPGVWHSGGSFRKPRSEAAGTGSMVTLHEGGDGAGSPEIKTLSDGLANLVSRHLFRSASETDTSLLDFREPLLQDAAAGKGTGKARE